MKSVFVSDLHAALRLPLARVDEGGVSSDRLRDVLSVLDEVGDYPMVGLHRECWQMSVLPSGRMARGRAARDWTGREN